MSTPTTNAVRQVLMNELGFTRESVREEMRAIVEAEAKKEMTRLVSQGHLEQLVSREFERLTKGSNWSQTTIHNLITAAAKKEAEAFIKDHLRFVVPLSSPELSSEITPT